MLACTPHFCHEKSWKIVQNSSKIWRNGAQKRSESDLGTRSAKRWSHKTENIIFFINYVDFWSLLGTPQKPRGRQKRPKKFNTATFGHPGAAKRWKKEVLDDAKKKRYYFDWFLDGFLMDLRSNLDHFFNDFCIIFCHDFWIDFWYFSKRRFFVFQCADFVKIIVFLTEKRRFYNFT